MCFFSEVTRHTKTTRSHQTPPRTSHSSCRAWSSSCSRIASSAARRKFKGRLSLFGRPLESSKLDIQQVMMCIYVKIRVFIYIYIYIYLHTSLYDYLQASTKVHVHVRLGELTIAAVALDEGAKPAAGSCFHNDWEAGFLVPVTWFQTCWWLICS